MRYIVMKEDRWWVIQDTITGRKLGVMRFASRDTAEMVAAGLNS